MWRRFIKFFVLLIVVIVLAIFVLCRLPVGAKIEAADVAYINKSPHFMDADFRAKYFEELLGNERLFISGDRELWVSKEDYRLVWSAPPKRAIRYTVYPVIAGVGRAQILEARDHDAQRQKEMLERERALIREANERLNQSSTAQRP